MTLMADSDRNLESLPEEVVINRATVSRFVSSQLFDQIKERSGIDRLSHVSVETCFG